MEFPGVVVIGPGVATAADQVMAVAQVRCLCWELPHAMVIAKRKKKKKRNHDRNPYIKCFLLSHLHSKC